MTDLQKKMLELLEKDSRITVPQLSKLLDVGESEIADNIAELEKQKIILKYHTVINWSKQKNHWVSAMIEVNITPQRDVGFDKIAERIYRFPQVKSVYLMSGSYDLCVIIEEKTLQDVSRFVFEKLAPLEHVTGTKTHFVMKRYKDAGVVFDDVEDDRRLVISP